jgi:hypothetical protein
LRSAACISRAETVFDGRAIVARNVSCFAQHLPLAQTRMRRWRSE